MGLKVYREKRSFRKTPEPAGSKAKAASGPLRFAVQLHRASRLHYDFRLEVGGVLKSWAVPKGPSLNPLERRLAVQVEDHPLEYGKFEGIIPQGNYGAGTVMLWDEGHFLERSSTNRRESEAALQKGLEAGHITFVLEGKKLQGEFALVRLKKGDEKSWLLLKKRDAGAHFRKDTFDDRSVLSGRSMEEIASDAPFRREIWEPRKKPSASVAKAPRLPVAKTEAPSSEASPPRQLKPMLPVQGTAPFDDRQWIFERGGSGRRALAWVAASGVQLASRQHLSYNSEYPDIVTALKSLRRRILFDGEIVEDSEGGGAYYLIHDLLHLDGQNLRRSPLSLRKKTLAKISLKSPYLRVAPYVVAKGKAFARQQSRAGDEWMMAKQISSPYLSGVQPAWQKIRLTEKASSEAKPALSHLDKIYWPQERYTKGDLVEYYRSVSSYLLPHFRDRPQSLHRHPNGIAGESFFHKDMTGYLPRFLETAKVTSESSQKSIHYALCQNEASLLYLVNLGCIEFNPWLARVGSLDHPDFVVIDLDPDGNDFREVLRVALAFRKIFAGRDLRSFCKTSGASGLHICLPLAPQYTFEQSREWALAVCREVHALFPKITSLERSPAKRRGKIYLDYLQNRRGATLASVYCVRPRAGATVSTPLRWEEVAKQKLRPEDFTMKNTLKRLKKVGELWAPMLEIQNRLDI